MANEIKGSQRELRLVEGEYAYVQDATKGRIKVYAGPQVVNSTAQEVPVRFNPQTGIFEELSLLTDAKEKGPVAEKGQYIVLKNPAIKDTEAHPLEGSQVFGVPLKVGSKIVIPGPSDFIPWPQQSAEVIDGHNLRSNQYLLVRVYDEEEAKKNWAAVVQTGETPNQPELTIGKLLIIKGTEVSFYIPPTGVEVVKDEQGRYVRNALTLERLEYAILIDENGNKRYERGPAVVFPEPTETFVEARSDSKNEEKTKKFRAIELTEIQGIHVKVIADYEENGREYKAGEELFITGKDTKIYYPREEHSAVKYDGKTKHFGTAVPAGEGRYVMNRMNSEITMRRGYAMLLPDPRTEVIVRRVLTPKQVMLWYPGNVEALQYNVSLENMANNAPTTRAGAISEGDYERQTKSSAMRGREKTISGAVSMNYASSSSVAPKTGYMESSLVSKDQNMVGDEFTRQSGYTAPRTLVLDTKYQGAPRIKVWTGYAVMVVNATGKRRVEKGPVDVLLEYDEDLEALEMSTGKPKTTDNLIRTVYLRTENNKVSDVIEMETADHVRVQAYLSYGVNFEGDPAKWFSVENYVKFLCDRSRSLLKGAVQKIKVEDFYANSTDIVRDLILGKAIEGKRPGLAFPENGMRVTDLDVLKVMVVDDRIRGLLDQQQHAVVSSNIELSNLRRGLDLTTEKERIAKEEAQVKAETLKLRNQLEVELAGSALAVTLTKLGNQLEEIKNKANVEKAIQESLDEVALSTLHRDRQKHEQDIELSGKMQSLKVAMLKEEAEAVVKRFAAAQTGFSEALLALSHNETLVKVAEAWNIQRAIGGDSVSDALAKVFSGSPVETLVKKLIAPSISNGNGENKAAPSVTPKA